MKDGILLKKKKKKFTSLGSSRKLSFTNHWTNEIHPLSTFVHERFHEHNLTFEKIFDTYDISIKKLLQAVYNRESTNESLEIVKLIIFPLHSMTR